MPSIKPRNQGKTAFVTNYLSNNPLANARSVNDAWRAAGRDGSISDTLVGKVRSRLGLAGNLRRPRTARTAVETPTRSEGPGKKRGPKPKSARPERERALFNAKPGGQPPAKAANRRTQMASLETEIDQLLFKVMNLGGMSEIEDSLRHTRRLLYQTLS